MAHSASVFRNVKKLVPYGFRFRTCLRFKTCLFSELVYVSRTRLFSELVYVSKTCLFSELTGRPFPIPVFDLLLSELFICCNK